MISIDALEGAAGLIQPIQSWRWLEAGSRAVANSHYVAEIHVAHSAACTGERCSRSARRADTGHWSATDLAALAGTGTLQCHRFSDTGMALSTGVPQTLATLGTDVPTESGSHANFSPKFALEAAQNPPRTLI